jgi:hypothetical protein
MYYSEACNRRQQIELTYDGRDSGMTNAPGTHAVRGSLSSHHLKLQACPFTVFQARPLPCSITPETASTSPHLRVKRSPEACASTAPAAPAAEARPRSTAKLRNHQGPSFCFTADDHEVDDHGKAHRRWAHAVAPSPAAAMSLAPFYAAIALQTLLYGALSVYLCKSVR